MNETQVCTKCKVEKPLDDFYSNSKTGRKRVCRECIKKYSAERQKRLYVKKTIMGKWNFSARMCYNRKCECKGCEFENFFSESFQKCQMHKAVKKIYNKYGQPPKEEDEQIL